MTSRERMLAAMSHQEPDRVPITFWGTIAPLRHLWTDAFDRVDKLLELGIDDYMGVGSCWTYHPDVTVTVSRTEGGEYPILVKELDTPGGALRMQVKKTPDYPWADPPLFCDHNWSRSVEFLIKDEADLDRLQYLLHDPSAAGLDRFRAYADKVKRFCADRGVLVIGHARSPSNAAMGLMGATNMMLATADNRSFVERLLGMLGVWSQRSLELVLDAGVDVVSFSGIYESTAFWSPRDYEGLFVPLVQPLINMSHEAGAKFHYFSDARIMQYLELWRDMGMDVISYCNPPPMGDADLGEIKRRVGDRIAMWGGINAPITIEHGTAGDVRSAVTDAIRAAALGGGLVLASADAIMHEEAYDNLMTMVRTCHEVGRYPITV